MRTPPGILGEIVGRTRADLADRMAATPTRALAKRARPTHRDFIEALRAPGLSLIAEFKPRSPSKGAIRPGATVEDIVRLYTPYASAISVLCDQPYFGGGYDVLARARTSTDRPILCKDFIVDAHQVYEARLAGADALLLMAAVLDDDEMASLLALARSLHMGALVEVHDAAELGRVIELDIDIVGVNSRDLTTLTIDHARMSALLDAVPAKLVRVAESGMSTAADVERMRGRAAGVLIGSTLMAAPDPAAKIEELGWRRS